MSPDDAPSKTEGFIFHCGAYFFTILYALAWLIPSGHERAAGPLAIIAWLTKDLYHSLRRV